jgi:hypothetical protein
MAYAGSQQLEKRLTRIDAKRRAAAKGVVYSVNHDGLIISRPRRTGLRFPLKGILLSVLGFMMFKVGLVVALGAADYSGYVQKLADGTVTERVGALVMEAGPTTLWTATQVKSLGL